MKNQVEGDNSKGDTGDSNDGSICTIQKAAFLTIVMAG